MLSKRICLKSIDSKNTLICYIKDINIYFNTFTEFAEIEEPRIFLMSFNHFFKKVQSQVETAETSELRSGLQSRISAAGSRELVWQRDK